MIFISKFSQLVFTDVLK